VINNIYNVLTMIVMIT